MIGQLVPTWADVLAIVIGAVSGSIIARRWGADISGVLIVAIVSGLGGGFIRDILLNRMPVALTNAVMIPSAVVAACVGFLFWDVTSRLQHRLDVLVIVLDALFLGIYAAIGTETSLSMGLPAVSCVFVGVLSGVGGGLLRDVMLNNEPEVLRPGALSAVAAIIGCAIYAVAARQLEAGRWLAFGCVGIIVAIRLLSVGLHIHTPAPRDLLTESRAGRVVARRVRLDRILPPEATEPGQGTRQTDSARHDGPPESRTGPEASS